MTVIKKLFQDLESTITLKEFNDISSVSSLCMWESPDTLIEKINNYKDFLNSHNLKWDEAHLSAIQNS